MRERRNPKFHLFDTGVARALTGRIRDPLSDLEVGELLETFILHELRAASWYQDRGGELSYWRSEGGVEFDFVWTRGDRAVAVEVKAGRKWQRGWGRALNDLLSARAVRAGFGVYQGKEALKDGEALVLPCLEFLERLHAGDVLA